MHFPSNSNHIYVDRHPYWFNLSDFCLYALTLLLLFFIFLLPFPCDLSLKWEITFSRYGYTWAGSTKFRKHATIKRFHLSKVPRLYKIWFWISLSRNATSVTEKLFSKWTDLWLCFARKSCPCSVNPTANNQHAIIRSITDMLETTLHHERNQCTSIQEFSQKQSNM